MCSALVLASASPRRQAFLQRLGVPFETVVADIDETPLPRELPAALACRLAAAKAAAVSQSVAHTGNKTLIVASDTVVAAGEQILGKPQTQDEAGWMLRLLRDRTHFVYTAIALLATPAGLRRTRLSTTAVVMRAYRDEEIAAYVDSGDPMDKAGGYAIQHPTFSPVARIEGCLSGVMGLPLGLLCDLLAEEGVIVEASLPQICEAHARFGCCRR